MSHFAIPLLSDDGRLRERKNRAPRCWFTGKSFPPHETERNEKCVTARVRWVSEKRLVCGWEGLARLLCTVWAVSHLQQAYLWFSSLSALNLITFQTGCVLSPDPFVSPIWHGQKPFATVWEMLLTSCSTPDDDVGMLRDAWLTYQRQKGVLFPCWGKPNLSTRVSKASLKDLKMSSFAPRV